MTLECTVQTRRRYLKALGGVSATGVASLAGCLGGGEDGDILIGNAAPFSGPVGSYGQFIEGGLEFAVQEINDDGGALGRDLTVQSEDIESDPEAAASTFQRLASDGAVTITGPVLSNVTIRLRREAEDQQVPLLPIQGSSPAILTRDSQYTFRLGAPGAPYYARATGEFVQELDVSSYGAIVADYPYGRSYQQGIDEYILPMDGLETTVEVAPVVADDFSSQLRAMPEDLDYMDLGPHPVGIYTIIPQMWELGLEPQKTSGPGDPLPIFYDALGDDVQRGLAQIHSVDPTTDEYAEVAQRYYDETGEFFDPFTAYGYVVGNLVAQAVEDAGEADPETVRDAISDIRYESLLAYPLEYTDWGELTEARLVALEFNLDTPSYYPEGNFSVDLAHETEAFEPLDPTEWE